MIVEFRKGQKHSKIYENNRFNKILPKIPDIKIFKTISLSQ